MHAPLGPCTPTEIAVVAPLVAPLVRHGYRSTVLCGTAGSGWAARPLHDPRAHALRALNQRHHRHMRAAAHMHAPDCTRRTQPCYVSCTPCFGTKKSITQEAMSQPRRPALAAPGRGRGGGCGHSIRTCCSFVSQPVHCCNTMRHQGQGRSRGAPGVRHPHMLRRLHRHALPMSLAGA
jgi:hypothetical protein